MSDKTATAKGTDIVHDVAIMSALSRCGLLPPRGPLGSLHNSFRAGAVRVARTQLARRYLGDRAAFVAALDRERAHT